MKRTTIKRPRIQLNESVVKKQKLDDQQEPTPEFEDYNLASKYYDLTRVPVGLSELIARVKKTDRVLDAGCGTGNYLCALSHYVKKVYPLEQNTGMLTRCLQKAQKFGCIIHPDEIYVTSLLDLLPIADNYLDVIMNNQVIHHLDTGKGKSFPNLNNVLREFHRVLVPGGFLAINFSTREQGDSFWWQYLIPHAKEVYRKKYIKTDHLIELLEDLGYVDIELVPIFEPLQGEHYYNVAGPLSKDWRKGDSTWSLVEESELAKVQDRVREMISQGKMGSYFDRYDAKRREIGQSTYLFARKSKTV